MQLRRRAREVALQVLYTLDILNITVPDAIELFWKNFEAPEEAREFSSNLITGAWNNKVGIDKLLAECSEHWSLSRMSRVDKAILRMAVYELQNCPDVPPKVTLNEAIDLGKIYGSDNSGAFINGILDALYAKLCKDAEAADS
jgi:transcription antitermination protein NusB